MKLLWLCNIVLPKIAAKENLPILNVGGWLVGLADELSQRNDIELTICAPLYGKDETIQGSIQNSYSYYCFAMPKKASSKKYINLTKQFEQILDACRPDIVHIWGTEYVHTLLMVQCCEKSGILDKAVISIQGMPSVYALHYYASLPHSVTGKYTIRDFLRRDNLKDQKEKYRKSGILEINAIKTVNHVIGRTDWDYACTHHINPDVKYHFCNEVLRDSFYNFSWSLENCKRYSIFISQGIYPIKGLHFMLEALPTIIKFFPKTKLYIGGSNITSHNSSLKGLPARRYYGKYISWLIKKYNLTDYIVFLGSLNEREMCERYLRSHVFVSSSSIENSPNSVGEAMILGVPTVASDVGGVKNLMTHNSEGFIYQHDAPYMLAHYICRIFENDELAVRFSENAKKHAAITHNRQINLQTLLDIYKNM